MFGELFKVKTDEEKAQERIESLKSIEKSIENEKNNPLQFSNWHLPIANILDDHSTLIKTIRSFVMDATPLLVLNSYNSNEFTEKGKEDLNKYILENLPEYFLDKPLFLRNGTFSNKFNFDIPAMRMDRNFVDAFSHISHIGLTVGAGTPSEIVIREFIEDVENNPTIYSGMPLRTEFRFFYDFDTNKVLGVSNYWDRKSMIENFLNHIFHSRDIASTVLEHYSESGILSFLEEVKSKEDLSTHQNEYHNYLESFLSRIDKIEEEYDEFKYILKEELEKVLPNNNNKLKGKWSIDIMKNGKDFYFIDMALMERSALLDEMELI